MDQTEVSPQHCAIDAVECGMRGLFRGIFRKRLPWWIWAPVIAIALVPLAENWLHRFGIELLHPQTAALVRAIDSGDMAQVRTLIDRGANINAQVPSPFVNEWGENPVTPLLWAHQTNRKEAIALLHARKAQIAPASDRYALVKAVHWDETEELRRLIREGANRHFYGKGGWTLLQYAISKRDVEPVKALIEAGFDVNTPAAYANRGNSPLHFAAGASRWEPDDPDARAQVIALLLAHGADPNARDDKGKTPLDIARQNHYKAVEDLLLNPPPKDTHP